MLKAHTHTPGMTRELWDINEKEWRAVSEYAPFDQKRGSSPGAYIRPQKEYFSSYLWLMASGHNLRDNNKYKLPGDPVTASLAKQLKRWKDGDMLRKMVNAYFSTLSKARLQLWKAAVLGYLPTKPNHDDEDTLMWRAIRKNRADYFRLVFLDELERADQG